MEELVRIARRSTLPEGDDYLSLLEEVTRVLDQEDPEYRPRDDKNRPGGLIYLKDLPTIVIPDLHGRMDFILRVLNYTPGEVPVFQLLQRGQVQVVCVGDGFHGEARAAERWKRAFKEFVGHYRKHRAMDEEMRESLGLMEMVMRLKVAFPEYFHFLL